MEKDFGKDIVLLEFKQDDSFTTVRESIKTRISISIENLENPLKEDLLKSFNEDIIGQKKAKEQVVDSILSRLNTITPSKGPIGVLFFSGPTGTGKTQTVKSLSKILFGYENSFIKIACENLQQSHTSSNLFGSPKGYVGYGDKNLIDQNEMNGFYDFAYEGGTLHEVIQNIDGFNIILFDEIEKAHPEVIQQLLGILDDGKIQNTKGDQLNFSNSLIIFTSNIGQKSINEEKSKKSIGFIKQDNSTDLKNIFKKDLEKHFSPEFIGRIHSFIDFESIELDDCKEIISKNLKIFNKSLKKYFIEVDYKVSISESVYDYIISNGFSGEKGARDLERFYKKTVEDNISNLINSKDFYKYYKEGNSYDFFIDFVDSKIKIDFEIGTKMNGELLLENKSENNNENLQLFKGISIDQSLNLFATLNNFCELYYLQFDSEIDVSEEINKCRNELKGYGFSDEEIKKFKNKSNIISLKDLLISQLSIKKGTDFGNFENSVILKIVKNIFGQFSSDYKDKNHLKFLENGTIKVFDIVENLIGEELNNSQIIILNTMIKNVLVDNYNIDL